MVGTYNGNYPDGSKSSGGYADFLRAPGHFAIEIPAGLPSSLAAPMLCGGVTVYSPLKQYGAGTERKNVGIAGIGGLGHYVRSILFLTSSSLLTRIHTGSHVRQGDGCDCDRHLSLRLQEGRC
jgi:D-arabinose 1-dehydrogenase-like Zn-dependent alcohol dehydrogenase